MLLRIKIRAHQRERVQRL